MGETAGIRRSVQAHPEKEGQDHQEAGAEVGVLQVQVEASSRHQENQTFRVGRRKEEEGADDPVLNIIVLSLAERLIKEKIFNISFDKRKPRHVLIFYPP